MNADLEGAGREGDRDPTPAEQEGSEGGPDFPRTEEASSAAQFMEWIFFNGYEEGTTSVEFESQDFHRAADALGLDRLQHLPDIIYRFKSLREELPQTILETAPDDKTWVVRSVARGRYAFELVSGEGLQIEPDTARAVTKIPDATPGIVDSYAQTGEQALLAQLRYNRLIDIFTGVTCYSLQNHFKSTLDSGVQVEIDELYVGLDETGTHYVIPVEAKDAGEVLTTVQTEQDIRLCAARLPDLVCRPIAAQFLAENRIALFELAPTDEGIRKIREKHYKLVPPSEIAGEDLKAYQELLAHGDTGG